MKPSELHRQLLDQGKFKEANELFIEHAPEGALKEASKAIAMAHELFEQRKYEDAAKKLRGIGLE